MSGEVSRVRFEVLGPVRVTTDSRTATLSGTLRLGLISLLLARANTPVSAEFLQNALWGGERDDTSAQRLQTNVHRLRNALDRPDRLSFDSGHYLLRVEPGELDTDRFDELVVRAMEDEDPKERATLLREALALWRGRPFQGIDLTELASFSQQLIERKHAAMEQLYSAELRCGRHAEVIAELTELVDEDPLRERPHALLMTALFRSGRPADALAAYRRARKTLVEELGLEPGAELRALEQQILAGEETGVAAPTLPPAQLPADARDFVGRAEELATLDRLSVAPRDGSMRVVVLTGTAGVGKSALAIHWAHEARKHFPDGQLYVDLQGFSPEDPIKPTVALGGFLHALGDDSGSIPPELTDRSALFRTRTDGKRVLVVLDNAASADQVRPLLPGADSCFVVVTSRDALDGLTVSHGAHRLTVGLLRDDDASALLHARAPGTRLARQPVARLVEQCGRLPLALRVVAERVSSLDTRDVERLVAELDTEQDLLDLLETGDERTSIRAVLSWSYQRLSPDAARMFQLCAFRCPHPQHYIDPPHAAALIGTSDVRKARRLLGELVRCGLVEPVPNGLFQMHPLLQSYATELADVSEMPAAQWRLIDYHMQRVLTATAFIDAPETAVLTENLSDSGAPEISTCPDGLTWLDTQRPGLLCVTDFSQAECPTVPIDFANRLWPYLNLSGSSDECRVIHTCARTAARNIGDRTAEGIAARTLGMLDAPLERYDSAEELLREAVELHEGNGTEASLATTITFLGTVLATTGRTREAISLAREAYGLCGGDASEVPAITLNSLGQLYRHCAQPEEAFQCVSQARDRARERDHQPMLARALFSLAELTADGGDRSTAVDRAHEALDVAKSSGAHTLVETVDAWLARSA